MPSEVAVRLDQTVSRDGGPDDSEGVLLSLGDTCKRLAEETHCPWGSVAKRWEELLGAEIGDNSRDGARARSRDGPRGSKYRSRLAGLSGESLKTGSQ